VTASVRAASKLRIAVLRLDKARRSYRSSAAISRALSSKIAASFCSEGFGRRYFLSSPEHKWSTKSPAESTLLCQEQGLKLANPERPVIGVLDLADEDPPTIRTHTLEVDLGFSDPSACSSAAASVLGPAILRAITSTMGTSAGSAQMGTFRP
jgi:hypothetical protein